MADINALVVASTEIIEKARLLDTNYDLWSARMIRWVQFGFPIKSLVCGVKWEDQQDYDHAYETLAEWRNYYLAGYPEEATERNLPTYSTGSMSSQALRDRDWYRARAREQAIIGKQAAGLPLDEEEQEIYDFWCEIQKIGEAVVEVAPENEAQVPKDNDFATVMTSGGFNDENQASCQSNAELGNSDWVDSPALSPESVREDAVEDDWGAAGERTLCSVSISPIQLRIQYDYGLRGKDYDLPPGIGKHIRAAPESLDSRQSILGDDALDNIPAETPYIFLPSNIQKQELPVSKEIRGLLTQHGESEARTAALYGAEVCHKDSSWLVGANPEVTSEMIAQCQEQAARNKVGAIQTLELLAKLGTNLDLIIPMVHLVMKDPKLCQAIHEELVARDIGLLKRANHKKSLRFHGRVETVLSSLDRWAMDDIESAIEDVRLILEDHELVLEILDALNGGQTQKDRPLIDPDFSGTCCAQCGKDLKELAVIYGRDHSTIMATGCRVCEDARLKRAQELLWKWHKHPELIDDEQYKKIFGVEKGWKAPEREDEACVGNFDCAE